MTQSAIGVVTLSVAALLAALVLFGVTDYPLTWWPLGTALAAYSVALWYRPVIFLVVVPLVLPAWDLGLWTGWTMVGEADLFIATTVAVLLIRIPLATSDFVMQSTTAAILGAFTACWLVATLIGITSSLDAPYSDNVFLRPDNAIRIVKGLVEALALLPLVRQRQRLQGDAVTWLGWGLAAGLAAVTLVVLAERLLFASGLDFSTAYRVAGPFSSMRVGGGHIGAYAALVLPFSLSLLQLRPRWLAMLVATMAFICGGYTIAVTFARTAYAASMVAVTVGALAWLSSAKERRIRRAAADLAPIILVLCLLSITAVSTGMHARFAASATDFLTRQDNWRAGLAVRDRGLRTALFGMGLGSYPHAMLMRSVVNRPSDLVLNRDDQGIYASMRVATPFFLGQKTVRPDTGSAHLTLQVRSDGRQTTISALLCDKVLLYSDNCRGADRTLYQPNQWTTIEATVATAGLGGSALLGLLHRPVELSLSAPTGHNIDVRNISLTNETGQLMLVNGDFAHNLDHWIFTDDSHVAWRMLNEYLMLIFEAGIVGLAAFVALAGLAFAGSIRACRTGVVMGAPVAGAIASFMLSGLFDNVLEAPRLATLFFLVCWSGLIQWESRAWYPIAEKRETRSGHDSPPESNTSSQSRRSALF